MAKEKMNKQGDNQNIFIKNGGYQPINEGYQPETVQKGYQPSNPESSIGNLPQGGTGQSGSSSDVPSPQDNNE